MRDEHDQEGEAPNSEERKEGYMSSQELQTLRAQFAHHEEVLIQKRRYAGVKEAMHRGVIVEKESQFATVRIPGIGLQKIHYKRLFKVPPPPTPPEPEPKPEQHALRAVPSAFANVSEIANRHHDQQLVKIPGKRLDAEPNDIRNVRVGEDVMVVETLGQNARFSKPRKGRVVERLHSGVRVVFADDKSEKAVQWNRLQRVEDPTAAPIKEAPKHYEWAAPPEPPAPPTELAASIPEPKPAPKPEAPAAPAAAPPALPTSIRYEPSSEVQTWLSMGSQILDDMVARQARLREEAAAKIAEADDLQTQITAFKSFQAVAEKATKT